MLQKGRITHFTEHFVKYHLNQFKEIYYKNIFKILWNHWELIFLTVELYIHCPTLLYWQKWRLQSKKGLILVQSSSEEQEIQVLGSGIGVVMSGDPEERNKLK